MKVKCPCCGKVYPSIKRLWLHFVLVHFDVYRKVFDFLTSIFGLALMIGLTYIIVPMFLDKPLFIRILVIATFGIAIMYAIGNCARKLRKLRGKEVESNE